MAPKLEYTPEEQQQIQEILSNFSPDTSGDFFSPMQVFYNNQVSVLQAPVGQEPVDSSAELETDAGGEVGIEDSAASDAGVGDLGDLGLGDLGGDLAGGDPGADLGDQAGDLGDLGIGDLGGDPAGGADLGGDQAGGLGDLGLGDLGGDPGGADLGGDQAGDLGDLGLGDLGGDPAGGADLGGDQAGDLGDLGLGDLGGDPAGGADLGGDQAGDLGDLGLGDLGGDPAGGADLGGDQAGDLGDLGLGDLGGDPGGADLGGDQAGDLGDLGIGDLGGDPAGAADLGGDQAGDLTTPDSDELEPEESTDSLSLDTPEVGGTTVDFGGLEDSLGNIDDLAGQASGGGLGDIGADSNLPLMPADGLSGDLSSTDISELGEQAKLQSGIGGEFTDQDLANIRVALLQYPPQLKKAVIDIVVNEEVPAVEQRLLMNMLIKQVDPKEVADFIGAHVGVRPSLGAPQYTKDGVEILYADELSPEALAKRRLRNRILLGSVAAAILAVVGTFSTLTFYRWFYVQDLYEMGLDEIRKARLTFFAADRDAYKTKAEYYFEKAVKKDGNRYDSNYLNRYGIAYMKARFYEESFTKLFGRANPPYDRDYFLVQKRAPLIRRQDGAKWRGLLGKGTIFTDKSGVVRTVMTPGAYMVDRLRDKDVDEGVGLRHQTLINLARFHSNVARDFRDKNDGLAIDYYRLILTLMNKPHDVEAQAGIGDIYYNQKKLAKAARQYLKIIDRFPLQPEANARLLNTYIEMYRQFKDPRVALAKHRELRNLGLEEDFPIYLMVKLAGFYTQLDENDVLIKYQIDPVDIVTNFNLRDNAYHLLNLAFHKEEERDGQKIIGLQYAEGFYQRGLFLLKGNERWRAFKQFQNAHHYDPSHYLAVNAMGEYYKNTRDFKRAAEYFPKAIEIYEKFLPYAGARQEDEALLAGDIGKVYYNAGSLLFLRYAGFPNADNLGFPNTRLYPLRAQKIDTAVITKRRERLIQAKEYFLQARKYNLQDKKSQAHLQYWLGWIDYMNGDFAAALETWGEMDPQLQNQDFALLLGQANSYYYNDQLRSALGQYLKVQADLQREASIVKTVKSGQRGGRPSLSLSEEERQMLLVAMHNNIGAVYERQASRLLASQPQAQNKAEILQKDALLHYWKAIEISRRAKIDHEIARTNVQLAFKQGSSRIPLLDDWLSPFLFSLKGEF